MNKYFLSAVFVLALVATADQVSAQAADPVAADAAADRAESSGIQDIVMTARRRDENVQREENVRNVPVAISAMRAG